MLSFRILPRIAVALAVASLAGCVMPAPRDDHQWAATMPQEQASAPPTDGSIYHADQGMELFNDARAHRVGDILTISLVESTQASKKASTSTSKKDATNIAAPTILGQGLTLNGKTANITTNGNRSFDGAGDSTQSNQLTARSR